MPGDPSEHSSFFFSSVFGASARRLGISRLAVRGSRDAASFLFAGTPFFTCSLICFVNPSIAGLGVDALNGTVPPRRALTAAGEREAITNPPIRMHARHIERVLRS